jgi:hypothetical protein
MDHRFEEELTAGEKRRLCLYLQHELRKKSESEGTIARAAQGGTSLCDVFGVAVGAVRFTSSS